MRSLTEFTIGLAVGAVFSVGVAYSSWTPDFKWRKEAITHGAAEWVVDQKTGNTSFRWKEVEK